MCVYVYIYMRERERDGCSSCIGFSVSPKVECCDLVVTVLKAAWFRALREI